MEAVLQCGEKLDDLVSKSEDLGLQSKLFYKTAKKKNIPPLKQAKMSKNTALLALSCVLSWSVAAARSTGSDALGNNDVSFESNPSPEQQTRIMEIRAENDPNSPLVRGSSCPAKTACYVSTCWIPFVGVACLACDAIQCRRDATENTVSFESNLSADQKVRIMEIRAETDPSSPVVRGSSCTAKTACYVSTCWIPFVGVACLACDAIQC